jgi:hypothetical protein
MLLARRGLIRTLDFFPVRNAVTSRIEWLKWMMRYGRPKTRARQVRLFLAFELYYQLCKLRCRIIDRSSSPMLQHEPSGLSVEFR